MTGIETIAAVAGAAATVGGTLISAKAQRDAADAERQRQQVLERRSRRQAIREMQIKRAQTLATAQGAGALQSSAAAGGVGSLSSQLGAELGFQSQMGGLADEITSANQRAATGSAIAGLGGAAFSYGANRGGLNFLNGAFNAKPTPAPIPTSSFNWPNYGPPGTN